MKLNIKSLLRDKNVLRLSVAIAVINLLGYLIMNDLDTVLLFIIVGFLTTYFSKNMIVVLFSAIVVANIFALSRRSLYEGMENKEESDDKEKSDEKKEDSDSAGKLDKEKTKEAAMDHLDSILDKDTIDKMSDHTKNLAERQEKLGKQIEKLQPVIANSMKTLDKLGGVNGVNKMVENLSNIIGKFSN